MEKNVLWNRKSVWCIILIGIGLVGLAISQDSELVWYNILIMPFVGGASFVILKNRWYLPYVFITLGAFISNVIITLQEDNDSTNIFFETLLFSIIVWILLIIGGIIANLLLHCLRTGKNTESDNHTRNKSGNASRYFSKILAALAACGLIYLILFIATSMLGNPITSHEAKKDIQAYIDEKYKDTDFKVKKVTYNSKFSEYNGRVYSDSSVDSSFIVTWKRGKILHDSYEFDVTERQNTIRRYEKEAKEQIRPLLKQYSQLGKLNISVREEYFELGKFRSLELDSPYDKSVQLPMEISIEYDGANPTLKEYASLVEDIHRTLITNGFHMIYYSIYNFENSKSKTKLGASNIAPKDIESNNLYEILEESLNKGDNDNEEKQDEFNGEREIYVNSFSE